MKAKEFIKWIFASEVEPGHVLIFRWKFETENTWRTSWNIVTEADPTKDDVKVFEPEELRVVRVSTFQCDIEPIGVYEYGDVRPVPKMKDVYYTVNFARCRSRTEEDNFSF